MQTKNPAQEMTKTQKIFAALAGAILLFIIPVGCASMMSESSSKSSSSQGEAEVTCEREIEFQVGKNPTPAYTQITETGEGAFTLYGTVTADYGSAKFTCQVTGAMGDGTATADVEIYE